jgi:hypothetical protein
MTGAVDKRRDRPDGPVGHAKRDHQSALGQHRDAGERADHQLFCDNLQRYLSGRPLRNVLDTEKLY